jgi:hypothetical protein
LFPKRHVAAVRLFERAFIQLCSIADALLYLLSFTLLWIHPPADPPP